MSRTVVVRYRTRTDAAETNHRLVEQVFAQLSEESPEDLRYAAFQLGDGVTFVHIAVFDGDGDPLSRSSAFAAFQQELGQRLSGEPEAAAASLVGSYRFLTQ